MLIVAVKALNIKKDEAVITDMKEAAAMCYMSVTDFLKAEEPKNSRN